MRFAVVTSHAIQYYSPLFRELAQRVDLDVFFAHRATPEQQAAAGFGQAFEWDVDLLSGFSHNFLRNVSRQPSAASFSGCDTPDIADVLEQGRYDAVLVTGWHLKTYWQTVWAAKRLGIPVLVRGDSQLGTARRRLKLAAKALLYPRLLRSFDAILYTGSQNKAYLDHYRYPQARQHFSPHCVDTQWFRERATRAAGRALRERLGIPTDAKVVAFAGKLVPFKRPLDVIEVCQRLLGQGLAVHALVAGSGELGGALDEAAARSSVPLHALGFCNQSQMPAVYAAADVLLLPSNGRETWGLVTNEALASGTPVAVSESAGSSRDFAAFTEVVACFRCTDIDGAAAAVHRFLRDRPLPDAFGDVNSRYGLAAATDGILRATAQVSAQTRRRSPQSRRTVDGAAP